MGLTEDARRSEPPHFFYLESEGAALTIGKPRQDDAPKPTASFEIGFEVADIQVARQKLESAGVRDLKEETMHWGDAIETHDPDGHRIVLYVLKKR